MLSFHLLLIIDLLVYLLLFNLFDTVAETQNPKFDVEVRFGAKIQRSVLRNYRKASPRHITFIARLLEGYRVLSINDVPHLVDCEKVEVVFLVDLVLIFGPPDVCLGQLDELFLPAITGEVPFQEVLALLAPSLILLHLFLDS